MVMVMALVIAALPQQAAAAAGNPSYCDSAVDHLNQQNFGTEVPVIMVHGRDGNASNWGSISDDSSFAGRVNDLPNVAVAHRFNYNTNNWVTDQNSGPKLAKTIDCVSQLSVHNGGKGKVVIVGYSMGGLVTREALSKRSSDNQRAIADEVGQVITIGTPHTGIIYPFLGAWSYNSTEMQALPKFPSQTIVHTIAGDVTKIQTDLRGNETRTRPYDDTLVSTFSAHSGWTIDSDKGGGFKDITCEKRYNWRGASQNAPCEHGQLISWANNGVREDTMDAIGKYVAWLNTPPVTQNGYTAGTITVNFDDRWAYGGYGASGPNEDIIGDDGSGALLIMNMANWCTDGHTMMECMTQGDWTNNQVGTAPAITVGGRTPDSSILFNQSGTSTGNRMFWCFETEKVCIDYGTGADVNLQPSAALLDLLHSATWSN
jgi:pimeloyl-ACP methyl ester carboxylesterase